MDIDFIKLVSFKIALLILSNMLLFFSWSMLLGNNWPMFLLFLAGGFCAIARFMFEYNMLMGQIQVEIIRLIEMKKQEDADE